MFSREKSDVMGIGFAEQRDQVDDDADQEQTACKKMQKPHARSSGNSAPPPHPRRSICLNAVSRKKPHPLINRMRLFQQDQSSSSRSYWRMEPVIALTS